MRDREVACDVLTVLGSANLGLTAEQYRRKSSILGAGDAWYVAGAVSGVTNTGAPPVNTLRVLPFFAGVGGVVDQIQFNLSVAGGAGSVSRCGIYNADPNSLYPTSLVFDAGQFATDAGLGAKTTPTGGVNLFPGLLYWFAFLCGVAGPTINTIPQAQSIPIFGFVNQLNNTNVGWTVIQAYGALPAAFPAGATYLNGSAVLPAIGVRFN